MRRIIAVALSSLALASPASVRGQEKPKASADTEFLTKMVPAVAASVKIIEHSAKNATDERVKDFAERVAKQHKESGDTVNAHARRLKIAVVSDPDRDSKEMIDKLSKLKGIDVDIAFLQWLSRGHADATKFENEVKYGDDAELKTYAKNSIDSGNAHLKEALEHLARLKK